MLRRCAASARSFATASAAVPPPFKASYDVKSLVAGAARIGENIALRKCGGDIARVVSLYKEFCDLTQVVDDLRQQRNAASSECEAGGGEAARARGRAVKAALATHEASLATCASALSEAAATLPNDSHPDAPVGPEDAARTVRTFGVRPEFAFTPVDHLTLGEALRMFDFAGGSRIAGSKFVVLMNDGVWLELALVSWALRRAQEAGFTIHMPPDVALGYMVEGCGFVARGPSSQIYAVANTPTCLVGTGEISLAALRADSMIASASLPLRTSAVTHNFRQEVGARGQHSKGLYRLHQFTKVELFVHCAAEESDATLDRLVALQASMFEELGLHCRVLDMPTEELGSAAYRKFDIEAWMPSRGTYGEVSSASNCTDYQSRRLNVRHRAHKTAKPHFVHTLNATACAVPRTMLAIMENFQRADGSIAIPRVLQPYMHGRTELRAAAT